MGNRFDYKCSNPGCSYEAKVSGGKDIGFCGEVEAMNYQRQPRAGGSGGEFIHMDQARMRN